MTIKPAEGSGPLEALKYQTWILKVPIHCEGCKKKVKRVLQTIDGVFMTNVDSQLHKVIVTGNVDAETLVRKLVRSGKHAELWPDDKPKKKSPGGKAKNSKEETQDTKDKGDKQPTENGGGESKDDDDGEDSSLERDENGGEIKEAGTGAGGGGGGGGGGKKKKKKKKKKGQSNDTTNNGGGEVTPIGALAFVLGPNQASTVPSSMRPIPLDHQYFHAYQPPVQFPPMAPYGMTYSSMYHPASNNTFHYASPMNGFTYSLPGPNYLPHSPPLLEPIGTYLDDYDYDDYYVDEGGCSIM